MWDMELLMSELQTCNCKRSLISSQDLPGVIASVIKVCVKPFNLLKQVRFCFQLPDQLQSLCPLAIHLAVWYHVH